MSDILTGGSLKMTETNTPTRKGERISTLSKMAEIETPSVGMSVFVEDEAKEYIILSLKDKMIGGVNVPNAQVNEYKALTWEDDFFGLHEDFSDFMDEMDETIKNVREKIDAESNRAKTSEKALAEKATARFDGFQKTSVSLNEGESDSPITGVVFYAIENIFIGKTDGGSFYRYWDGESEYMNGTTIHRNKLYLYGGEVYIWDGNTLVDVTAGVKALIEEETARAQKVESVLDAKIEAEKQKVAELIGEAPDTLNSIHEIADWINNDKTGAAAMATHIGENKAAIEAEVERAEGAEAQLGNDIATEAQRAEAAEQLLQGKIDTDVAAEAARAQAAEQSLQSSINLETTRAQAAEQSLQSSINLETTRAQAAEEELNNRKADEDGYHSKMTTGFADNLVGRGEAVDAQFTYRPSGGTQSIEDGVARIERIKGNTIVWNQLAKVKESKTINGVTIESRGDGSYKVYTAEDTPTTGKTIFNVTDSLQAGRKYAVFGSPSGSAAGTYCLLSSSRAESGTGAIITTTSVDAISIFINTGITINTPVIFRPQVFDLTQMFGVGNEPTKEEFKTLFPYTYEYNEGELISMTANSIKSVGFNLLNLNNRTEVVNKGITYTPTSERELSESQVWNTISYNGYVNPNLSKYTNIIIGDNTIAATGTGNATQGYGLGFPVRVLPNVKYTMNYTGSGHAGVGYYNQKGIVIDSLYTAGPTFTTPADCYWAVIVFIADSTLLQLDLTNVNLSIAHTGYRDGEVKKYKAFTRELPIKEYFPNGMKSAGNAYDEITKDKVVKRVGERDYQSGDESDSNVMTDGVKTTYMLAQPDEIILSDHLNLDYEVSDFGTEEAISEENSAPFRADVVYGFNAVDTIRNNRTMIAELLARIEALEGK